MKLFQTVKQNLGILYFKQNSTDSYILLMRQHWSCFLKSAFSLISLFAYLIFVAETVNEFMFAMFLSTASFFIFVAFTSTVFKTFALFDFFDHAEAILIKRLIQPKWIQVYENTDRIVQKWSKIAYYVMVRVSLPCFILPKAVFSFYQYYTTDLGDDAFELSLPMWLPFDWKNPVGYLLAMACECVLLLNPLRYMTNMMTLAFTMYVFAIELVNDFINDVHLFDEYAKAKRSQQHQQQNIHELLSELICAHSEVKKLIGEFAYLYETILMAVFAGSTIAIAIAMLMAQMEISKDDFAWLVLLELIVCGVWSVIIVFFACETGERAGKLFEKLDDEVNQFHWYQFPLKIQQMLPTVLIIVQEPVTVKCFGSSILCTRQCFKQVVNKGYSSFMVLHKVY